MTVCSAIECNGGLAEEPELEKETTADQEVPRSDVRPELAAGEFDFNEFFNLEKTMPGLASVRDVSVFLVLGLRWILHPMVNLVSSLFWFLCLSVSPNPQWPGVHTGCNFQS